MSSTNSASPANDDDYFNDLSRNPSNGAQTSISPLETQQLHDGGDSVPRPKRIACVVCRKRKLRCDGTKPSCGTCSRLGHDCAYDEVRRKSGPKRGYVKQLEARLAQVETMLKTQNPQDGATNESTMNYTDPNRDSMLGQTGFDNTSANGGINFTLSSDVLGQDTFDGTTQPPLDSMPLDAPFPADAPLTWEMIGLGIDEPLPPEDVVDELYQIYFSKIHPSVPMIHRRRFLAAMSLAPNMRPPVCLRYIMWCLAASVSDKYMNLQEHFYQRARKYIENDEMKGYGENTISIAHSQCWTLIATYEFKLMYFPRAWLSTGRGARLALMMGLHRQDGVGLDVKQCLPPPRDWTEREERRRTFWVSFCADRYASIGTGWPVMIEESDILTNLPASEEAFDKSKPQRTLSLKEAMTPSGATSLSGMAGVVLMASLFGRNLIHLHRPDANDNEDDLNGEFWRRHRHMDAILSNTSLSLPPHLRLPAGINDANIVFLNMNIHTSTICLHQAAIFKADKNRLPPAISSESKVRCVTAAAEIANIMRSISHMDLSGMNPFISFCLYVAARVFVQYIKSRPDDEQVKASLRFLLSAMHAMKRKNPLTESFLVQLDVDLEGTGMDDPNNNSKFAFTLKRGVAEVHGQDEADCCPILNPRQSQTAGAAIYTADSESPGTNNSPRPDHKTYQGVPLYGKDSSLPLPTRQKPSPSAKHIGKYQGEKLPGVFPSQRDDGYSPSTGEMDLTPDTSTLNGSDQVNRPSPSASSTSNKGSAGQNPSFTPPSFDDTQQPDSHHFTSNNPLTQFMGQTDFSTMNAISPSAFMPPTPGKEQDGGFVIPPGWDLGSTGLTPGGDGMFSQIMAMGMGWDAQTMEAVPEESSGP